MDKVSDEKRCRVTQKEKSILQLFPGEMRELFGRAVSQCDDLSEIRIRAGRPVIIRRRKRETYLGADGKEKLVKGNEFTGLYCPDANDVERIFVHLCRYSPYAHGEALKQGFLTVAGGHRIGVAGQVVLSSEGICGIRNIRFLNIRISHEIRDAASEFMPYMYESGTNQIYNCLIIAPPGMGKTTMLRDLVRQISDGTAGKMGVDVAIVDERSEIAGCFMGEPQCDVGIRTDVLDACPKAFGMEMMLRSMAPEVIAVDEIALREDVNTLLMLLHCGVKVIATIHGETLKEVMDKPYIQPLFQTVYFQRFLIIRAKGEANLYDEKGECLV